MPVDPSSLGADLMAVTQPPQMPVQTHAHMHRGIRNFVSHAQAHTHTHTHTHSTPLAHTRSILVSARLLA